MGTLIVAEKKKAAKAIAESLGPVQVIKEKKKLEIYNISQKDIFVIPLRGHILEYRNSENFKSWSNSNPREIIIDPKAIEKFPKSYAYPYIKTLKKYAKKCDKCIIGTDADVEGCAIGLYDALPFIKKVNNSINIFQMWLNSLQANEIQSKFKNLILPKWNWADSGDARALIDAIIGFSATREVTNTFKPLLEKINQKFTSIGRVQTSLLYLIYLRDKKIKEFTPVPYLTIEALLNYHQYQFKAYHQNNPFRKDQMESARIIYDKIKDEKLAKILNKNQNQKILNPPTPLNTSKALILLTKNLRINAKVALKVMSDLYLNKIITYPRTDSDIYKNNFDHISIIKTFSTHPVYGPFTNNILKKARIVPTKGKKDAGDHPPITPLESLPLSSNRFESKLQAKVYDLLARHYLALFGDKATESKVFLKLSIKGEIFNSQIVSLISEGFLRIAPFLKRKYDPEIKIDTEFIPIKDLSLLEKETKPPPEYSDTSLLKLMEKHNLGTKSTRPVIIQLLETRRYINRNKRSYKITDLGIFLIENLKKIWLPFLRPKFTGMIENLLEDVKLGKKSKEEVIKLMREIFLKLFDKFRESKSEMISKIEKMDISKFQKKQYKKRNIKTTSSKCPFCKQDVMKLVSPKGKRRFLVCMNENCKEKYLSVPKNGRIYILKNSFCSKCGFNIFKISTRKGNKSFHYYLCPYCWNIGLSKSISGKGFCSNCEDYEIINNKCIRKK
ncbi:MAG: DNA topoisomerase [Promethearchaeati archaeon]